MNQPANKYNKFRPFDLGILLQGNYHKDIKQNGDEVHFTMMFKAGQFITPKKKIPTTSWQDFIA